MMKLESWWVFEVWNKQFITLVVVHMVHLWSCIWRDICRAYNADISLVYHIFTRLRLVTLDGYEHSDEEIFICCNPKKSYFKKQQLDVALMIYWHPLTVKWCYITDQVVPNRSLEFHLAEHSCATLLLLGVVSAHFMISSLLILQIK